MRRVLGLVLIFVSLSLICHLYFQTHMETSCRTGQNCAAIYENHKPLMDKSFSESPARKVLLLVLGIGIVLLVYPRKKKVPKMGPRQSGIFSRLPKR